MRNRYFGTLIPKKKKTCSGEVIASGD
jgi:hypothetical protein